MMEPVHLVAALLETSCIALYRLLNPNSLDFIFFLHCIGGIGANFLVIGILVEWLLPICYVDLLSTSFLIM